MKPRCERNTGRRGRNRCRRRTEPRFPVTDCNFQVFSLDRYYGGSTRSLQPPFLHISREYFPSEARRKFFARNAFFFSLPPLFSRTFITRPRAHNHFLHLPP